MITESTIGIRWTDNLDLLCKWLGLPKALLVAKRDFLPHIEHGSKWYFRARDVSDYLSCGAIQAPETLSIVNSRVEKPKPKKKFPKLSIEAASDKKDE